MKYFKQNYVSGSHELTMYGSYEDSNITPEGYIYTSVYSIDCADGINYYECSENYFKPDEITAITEEEYLHVIEQLQKVDWLQIQIDEVLKALL